MPTNPDSVRLSGFFVAQRLQGLTSVRRTL
ncbi:hypothetical protein CBM2585_A70002 [Cupriavidus taiwanensis]|nr:hypothetical protein CBM2585_A70002 [Cupriavidus taiwanensis]